MDYILLLLIILMLLMSVVLFYTINTFKKVNKLVQRINKLIISNIAIRNNGDNKVIEILNDEKYYYFVLNQISNAEKELNIVMFSIYQCKKTQEIIDEVINARKRGVMVRIILDGEIESNKIVNKSFSSEKIPVKLTKTQRIHNKLIIVDDKSIIIGSHNWTDKALFENRESSVAITDINIINEEKEYFESLWSSIK
ncbi:phospholipase D family protein [Methanococcus aeolicus]|uniref:Phospholipase D/Transphosphatidylase n=1 Tax=Methanococcus aeolicus (strain ATCC BAA-1280 / DSM 17508 / OCM 812 / Nankai-3) TaxID=419665 RepID=A6UT11_META3|nr:phospholipase D family protein [Methanococcus aeolicus]ABR55633.1 phospholipase D/Transphosphatidylase [Methanococcus aeolicus Nankai-3]UXM85134.1 phospholipase D family protein [Methanococcus aeolicus]